LCKCHFSAPRGPQYRTEHQADLLKAVTQALALAQHPPNPFGTGIALQHFLCPTSSSRGTEDINTFGFIPGTELDRDSALVVEERDGRIFVSGQVPSRHIKQLAFQGVLEMISGERFSEEITIR
jgi:hypothetical protein